jgi:predicted ATP-grasp superfamily ATP-dependent carboligase
MIYRAEIDGVEDFITKYIGGRKVAMAATSDEAGYLIGLNNQAIELHKRALEIADTLADIANRERDLNFFIAERAGLV